MKGLSTPPSALSVRRKALSVDNNVLRTSIARLANGRLSKRAAQALAFKVGSPISSGRSGPYDTCRILSVLLADVHRIPSGNAPQAALASKGSRMSAFWRTLLRRLDDQLLSRLSDPTEAKAWLNQVEQSDTGFTLCASVAVDLLSGAVTPETYATVFGALRATGDSYADFAAALAATPDRPTYWCACLHRSEVLRGNHHYVRVLSLRGFIDYYLKTTFSLNSFGSDLNTVRRALFSDRASKFSLGKIRSWWTGGTPVVWTTSSRSLSDLTQAMRPDDRATKINDALALGYRAGEELVAVHYPPGADKTVSFVQPTVLDSKWNSPGFYLSYRRHDGWGRTQSCSGHKDQMPERVHGHFKNLTEEYWVEYIGSIETQRLDRAKLRREARRRLEELLQS